jgi:hypothetical protein
VKGRDPKGGDHWLWIFGFGVSAGPCLLAAAFGSLLRLGEMTMSLRELTARMRKRRLR